MTITLPECESHWYTRQGEPRHTVPTKDGKSMRSVNLRWDRSLNLLPSSTNILSVKAKPIITDYKVKQALMAAVTLPRIEGEGEDEFMKRVVVDMEEHSKAARAFGTKIHKYTENLSAPQDPELEPYVAHYRRWQEENVKEVIWAEKVLVNEKIGYAGTADRLFLLKDGRIALSDLKTQGIKERVTKTKGTIKNDPGFYPEWEYQLVSYGGCLQDEPDAYISVVIDSLAPGPCHIYEWPLAGRRTAWRAFLACHYLWCVSHNYFCSDYWN